MPQDKLLRPLHRRRTKRKVRAQVLNSEELCAAFNVSRAQLVEHLQSSDVPFHIDSQGEIWASQPLKPPQ